MPPKRSAVFLQNACLQHRYIRSKDLSGIVERPERLRAVTIGLAAAVAHLEDLLSPTGPVRSEDSADASDLAEALERLQIQPPAASKVPIIQSQATANLLQHPAVKFVHGDIEGDTYLETLKKWAEESVDKISQGGSEIPEGYSQGDLYLCPESIIAMEGAVGTVCEAVDTVIRASKPNGGEDPIHRAFVAVRPPGHHCGEDTPSGFCFINNVAVGAAHAHLQHGISRVVIFDIDLHHGNGTQSIVWQINEETYRQKLEKEAGAPEGKPGAQIYYGSIHDILSYPCEDGKLELVQAASVSLHQAHGQFIENIHLQTYTSEEHFWTELYEKRYSKLLRKAEDFLEATGGPGDDVMVFISCGMDACEHEYESMSRHNRRVPTSFYYRFARDACAFSDKYAGGRLVSVLEGGYSDRALTSASMAHFLGLKDLPGPAKVDESWWNVENLAELEKATKKRRGGRPSLPASGSTRSWIERTLGVLAPLDATAASVSLRSPAPPLSMTLRNRSKATTQTSAIPSPSAHIKAASTKPKSKGRPSRGDPSPPDTSVPVESVSSSSSGGDLGGDPGLVPEQRKLPRVILRLGKQESESST